MDCATVEEGCAQRVAGCVARVEACAFRVEGCAEVEESCAVRVESCVDWEAARAVREASCVVRNVVCVTFIDSDTVSTTAKGCLAGSRYAEVS